MLNATARHHGGPSPTGPAGQTDGPHTRGPSVSYEFGEGLCSARCLATVTYRDGARPCLLLSWRPHLPKSAKISAASDGTQRYT